MAFTAHASEPTCRSLFINHQAEYEKKFAEYEDHWQSNRAPGSGRSALQAVLRDTSQGPRKLNMYRALGYRVEGERILPPSFAEFTERYLKVLNRKKIAAKDRMLPAVLLVRHFVTKPSEYRWITPGVDAWPKEDGFRFYNVNGYDAFNLSPELFAKALAQGKFPLLSDSHDPEHLVGFALHPSYMRAIRHAFSQPGEHGPSFENRMYFALELLSLANPRATLPLKTATNGFTELETFKATFSEMPEAELIAHAQTLARNYDSFMIDYGGAVVRSSEKFSILENPLVYRARKGDPSPKVLVDHLTNSPVRNDQPYAREHQASFSFAVAPRYNLSQLLLSLEKLEATPAVLKILKGTKATRATLIDLMRQELARTEFILWNTSQTPASEWASALLVPRIRSLDSRPVRIMRGAFGEGSYAYRQFMNELDAF